MQLTHKFLTIKDLPIFLTDFFEDTLTLISKIGAKIGIISIRQQISYEFTLLIEKAWHNTDQLSTQIVERSSDYGTLVQYGKKESIR